MKEKDLPTLRIDLESKGRQLQEDFNTARQQQFAKTMDAIKTVIDAVDKERGLDLIVENPVFAKPEPDVPHDVLTRLTDAGTKYVRSFLPIPSVWRIVGHAVRNSTRAGRCRVLYPRASPSLAHAR